MRLIVILISAVLITASCYLVFAGPEHHTPAVATVDTAAFKIIKDSAAAGSPAAALLVPVRTDSLFRDSLIAFAKTLISTPYLYASKDPAKGFDCSGFINYVFNHFNITVPRSSYDFINAGKKVALDSCRGGDLILFTGTNPQEKNIGHIGIVCNTRAQWPSFIHSSSGKANGVTITSMEAAYYQSRFVAVVDVIAK